jgi:hypothetical protein
MPTWPAAGHDQLLGISEEHQQSAARPDPGALHRVWEPIFNSGGTLRNRGVEVAIDVFPVDHPDFTWRLGTSFFANRSKITSLPIPAFETGGFGTSLGAFRIEEGKSATQIVGNTSPTTVGIVGDAARTSRCRQQRRPLETVYHRHPAGLEAGGDVINLTQFLYDIQHNAGDVPDGGALAGPTSRPGIPRRMSRKRRM